MAHLIPKLEEEKISIPLRFLKKNTELLSSGEGLLLNDPAIIKKITLFYPSYVSFTHRQYIQCTIELEIC